MPKNLKFTHRSKENTHGGAAALFGEVVETIKDEEDYILFIADDIEMIEPGWDVMSARVFEAVFPDKIGTVCYDDGINHGRLNGHPYSNKKTFNHYGTLRAGYWHYFFDNDFTTFPQIDNNLIYVPQIALYNKHWILGLSPKDSTYVNAENKFWKHDEEVWHRRLYEAGFVIKDKQIVRIR